MENDAEFQADLERFEEAESTFFMYLQSHPFSTKSEIVTGLGWPALKVDIFLERAEKMGVTIPTPSPNGETRYEFVDLFAVHKRRTEQGRFGTPAPREPKGKSKDYFLLLKKHNLL